MKLEVGKSYRTRGGENAVICERVQNPFDAWLLKGTVGMRERSWTRDGRAGHCPENDSFDDLVAEWESDPTPATGSNPDPLRDLILTTFENPESWPATDGERIALLRRLYRIAKGGAQ